MFAEAKSAGFDVKVMRKIIAERRRDKDAVDEEQALLDVYRRALGMLADLPLGRAAVKEKFGEVDADQVAMEPAEA